MSGEGFDLSPIAIGGVLSMLVTLFGFFMKAMISAGTRSDTRNEAEIARVQVRADLDIARADARADLERRRADYWRDQYIGVVDPKRTAPPPAEPPLESP